MIIPEITLKVNYDKNVKKSELIKIGNSQDAYEVFKQVFDADKFDWIEQTILLCMNNGHKVIGFVKISSGGMTETSLDPKVVFVHALHTIGCCSIMLAHNHPSGNLKPSNEDIKLTQKIRDAGKLLDITLLDHLILNDEGYYSFCDEGTL